MDNEISVDDLNQCGIEVVNVSGSFEVEGEFDLAALAEDLSDMEYDPDDYRNLIYRGDNAMVLLPPRGRVSIVQATTPSEIRHEVDDFVSELNNIGLGRNYGDIQIENIVATANLDARFDLSAVTLALGLEITEYEPEQFPGVIYRPPEGSVILLFSSGKLVITAAVTYKDVLEAYNRVKKELRELRN